MKKHLLVFTVLVSLFPPIAPASAQDTAKVVVLSTRVGTVIDQTERTLYHLFASDKDFVSATFYRAPDSSFFARVESKGPEGKLVVTHRGYSQESLLRMAEIINHHEDLVAGRYILGNDPPTIQIVGGPSIRWSDEALKNTERKDEPSVITAVASTPSTFSPEVEFRFSGGYGFPKGGNPVSDYDQTYTSNSGPTGSTTTVSVQNVNDKYFSLGQGARFEAGFVFYLQDNLGLFLESGYSTGSESAKSTAANVYTYYPNPPTSSSSTYSQSFNFGYVPVLVGLHFRTTEGNVKPYGGAGAGLFFQTGLTLTSNSTNSSFNIEQEMKATTNTPIGYVGYVGFNIALTPTIALFMEAKATLVSFYITRTEMTKYTINDTDQLRMMNTSEKITVYEADKEYTQSNSGPDNTPSNGGPPRPLTANSVGITIGLAIRL